MPRPSSGEGNYGPGTYTDRQMLFLSANPIQWMRAYEKAVNALPVEYRKNETLVKLYQEGFHWRDHGTSYIVDELIGGPFDD